MDINQSDTLNKQKGEKDERHICPLQLDVIYRSIDLWSLKGDIIFSPFTGIGSEGFVALQNKRKFIGIELKRSYWKITRASKRVIGKRRKCNCLFHPF